MKNQSQTRTDFLNEFRCTKCKNGFVQSSKNPNTMMYCECFEMRQKVIRLNQIFHNARIPLRYQGLTLETFPNKEENLERMKLIETYTKTGYVDYKNSLFLHGDVGRGKTGLSLAILSEKIKQFIPSLFIQTTEVLNRIKATYSRDAEFREDEVLTEVKEVEFLVLDDLGTEKPTEWVCEKLFEVINARYNSVRPTVITSNLDLNQITGQLGERIADRIIEMAVCLKIEGVNIREFGK